MRMAMQSEKVTMASVGAAEFPDTVRRYRITGVPKTVVNDQVEILGAQPESLFVAEALRPFVAGS
jgi:predicted DsbA family dithiol-disulfide isomerase